MQDLQSQINGNLDPTHCPFESIEIVGSDCTAGSAHGMDPNYVTFETTASSVQFFMNLATRVNLDYNVCIRAKRGTQYFVTTQRFRINKCVGASVFSNNLSPSPIVKAYATT